MTNFSKKFESSGLIKENVKTCRKSCVFLSTLKLAKVSRRVKLGYVVRDIIIKKSTHFCII